ncbi:MAG: 2Fe-2S iron-sulfur cluster binding domain-containing protein [Saprospiraceae bacterium]|nr:2Fe-2S iron-sulfur cluster binding domain-containing protein [Saprospiraceae bacterium]
MEDTGHPSFSKTIVFFRQFFNLLISQWFLFIKVVGKESILIFAASKQIVEINMSETSSKASIKLDGEQVEIEIKDQTILQTLIDEGYDPPFSCTSGVCTTCMAKLTKGKVDMEVNYGLDEDEVAEGYILTCQSHPTTEEVELSYDV